MHYSNKTNNIEVKKIKQNVIIYFLKIFFLFLNFFLFYFSFFYKSYFDNLKNKIINTNNKQINVSIILPAYNVECCIAKCIQSLLNQTLKNIEIILINDGSTDNTLKIIEKFSKLDSRIKVVSKNNGGVASARNLGVTLSKGKYIDFVDPDDFIELNTYEILYNLAEKNNLDMITYTLNFFMPDNESDPKIIKLNKDKIYFGELENYVFNISGLSTNKFYLSSLFKSHNYQFIFPPLNMGEDLIVNYHIYLFVHKFAYLNEKLYHYRIKRPGKLSYNFNKNTYRKFFDESMIYLKKLPQFYKENNLVKGNESLILKMFFHYYNFYVKDEQMKKIFYNFIKEQIFFTNYTISKLPKEHIKYIKSMINKY